MLENSLLKQHFVGLDGFVWWIGQVASESAWTPNIPGSRQNSLSGIKGFGERYKVRIMGYHTADVNTITDDDLPWASVMYPVTAGGGSGGSSQSANIRQGTFVFGFFLDGQDAQNPIIMGVLGYNSYTNVTKSIPPVGFIPFDGHGENSVAEFNVKEKPEVPPANQTGTPSQAAATTATPTGPRPPAAATIKNSVEEGTQTVADKGQLDDGKRKSPIARPDRCEKANVTGIQKSIQNTIKDIEDLQGKLTKWENAATGKLNAINQEIQKKIANAAKDISKFVKDIIGAIRQYVTEKTNNIMKDIYYALFPNERPNAQKGVKKAVSTLYCMFNKIISNLLKMIGRFLAQILDRFINTPLCAIENFIGSLLGKLTGLISGVVDQVLGTLSSLIGGAFSLAGSIIGFVKDILSFFTCDEDASCPDIKEWSIWDGPTSASALDLGNIQKIFDQAVSLGQAIGSAVDPDNFNFDLDFSDVFEDTCNIGPLFCGPPTIEFFGGGGSGAAGNVIVGSLGEILSVDLTSFGSGYISKPSMQIKDACGKGDGAIGYPVLGFIPPTLELTARRVEGNTYDIIWSTKNAKTVKTNFGFSDLNGTFRTTVDQTRTFTVTAYGKRSQRAQRSVTISPTTGIVDIVVDPTTPAVIDPTYIPPNILDLDLDPTTYTGPLTSGIGADGLTTNTTGNSSSLVDTNTTGNSSSLVDTNTFDNRGNCLPIPQVTPLPESIDEITPDEIGIVKVVFINSGVGYLKEPDGSLGGDGRTWAESNQTVIRRLDGTYDRPYNPGETIEVNACDEVIPPIGNPYRPKESVIVTAPAITDGSIVRGTYPSKDTGEYPVILYICDVVVVNGGINYSEGDKVLVSPDNGAEFRLILREFGVIDRVEIISGGLGFTERPTITVQSDTGYNAILAPVFCVNRIGDTPEDLDVPSGSIIQVIDCVGKV